MKSAVACAVILAALVAGISPVMAQRSYTLVHARTIGSSGGPLSFGLIADVAANDSLLAIADAQTCQITLYNLRSAKYVGRWGGCGGGPAEFLAIQALAWAGDSLLVADQRGKQIHVLGPNGKEVRIIRPELGVEALVVTYVSVADDSTLVLGLGLAPSISVRNRGSAGHSFVAIIDSRTGIVRGRALEDADARSRSNGANIGRRTPVCLSSGRNGVLASLSPWGFEGSVRRVMPTDSVLFQFATRVRDMAPSEPEEGQFRPAGYASVACSDDVLLFKWSKQDRGKRDGTGHLEVRDRTGRLLLAKDLEWPRDSLLFGAPSGSIGNRFYFRANTVLDYPAVMEFRLVVKP